MSKQTTPYRMTALSDIKPYDRNPRIITQAAVDAVARSIQAFGFRQPIVVDKNGVILAGHTRYRAAQQLGMAEVPVVWETDITDVQARGYRIADNKVAELSAWDRDALDAEVRALAGICGDDLGSLGLADWELDRILHEPTQELQPAELDELVNTATTSWAPREGASASSAPLLTPPYDAACNRGRDETGPMPSYNGEQHTTMLRDQRLTIMYSADELDDLASALGVSKQALERRTTFTVKELSSAQNMEWANAD